MTRNRKTEILMKQENVDGEQLTLKIDKNHDTKARFTIMFSKNVNRSPMSMLAIVFAALFCIIALFYIRINVIAITVIVVVFLVFTGYWITYSVQSESLLALPGVGIQSSVQYLFHKQDKLVPWICIDDIIINEVVKMCRVLSYLTILVKPNNSNTTELKDMKLIPLFKYTKPRLKMLMRIYTEIQPMLKDTIRDVVMGSGDRA